MSARNQTKYLNKLVGKRVIVFGGTSGIGFATAEAAIEYGAEVIISGSNQERIDSTIQKLQSSYPDHAARVTGAMLDLTNVANLEAGLKDLFATVTSQGTKPINHIVLTAREPRAVLGGTTIEELDPTTVHLTSVVRMVVPMTLAKVAPSYMVKDNIGETSMIFTSGTMAFRPGKGWTIVAANGAAVDGLVRGLAVDLSPQIRVNGVAPGAIRTPLLQGTLDKVGEGVFRDGALTKTIGAPEDMAEVYLYLMKDRFITGQMILSDGGRVLA